MLAAFLIEGGGRGESQSPVVVVLLTHTRS